jgi:hypothetical protein
MTQLHSPQIVSVSPRVVRITAPVFNKASREQKQLAAEQAQFYRTLTANYAQQFAGQNAILQSLRDTFTPILQRGPGQQGFTAPEPTAMRTGAMENVGGAYQNAATAVNERMAALGGGNAYLPSGAAAQVNAALAQQAAEQEAGTQNQITMANYDVGRQNFYGAASALGNTAQMFSPTSYIGGANTAGQNAFQSATTIQQENSAWKGALGGMVGGVLTAGVGSGKGLLGKI